MVKEIIETLEMEEDKILKILNSNRIYLKSEFELCEEEFEGEDETHYVKMYIDSNPSPNVINEKDWVHQCISKDAIMDIIKEAQDEIFEKLVSEDNHMLIAENIHYTKSFAAWILKKNTRIDKNAWRVISKNVLYPWTIDILKTELEDYQRRKYNN